MLNYLFSERAVPKTTFFCAAFSHKYGDIYCKGDVGNAILDTKGKKKCFFSQYAKN